MKPFIPTLLAAAGLMMPLVTHAKPTIGAVQPVIATANVPVTLQASVSSQVPLQSCNLWVDLADVGPMTIANGFASRSYTFPNGGSRIAFVFCRDQKGGMNSGATTAINVTGATQNVAPLSGTAPEPKPIPKPVEKPVIKPEPIKEPVKEPVKEPIKTPITEPTKESIKEPVKESPERPAQEQKMEMETARPTALAGIGDIVKAICPTQAAEDHPCRSVYYIGKDGKRHAFPNSRVFFSWYRNFDSLKEISEEALSAYDLGDNVKYRAGVKMVKFATDPKVYAIGRGGVLRWIKSEELARAFYGNDWNKKIDDIPDTFLTNYTMGTDIETTSDYNPEAEFNNSKE